VSTAAANLVRRDSQAINQYCHALSCGEKKHGGGSQFYVGRKFCRATIRSLNTN